MAHNRDIFLLSLLLFKEKPIIFYEKEKPLYFLRDIHLTTTFAWEKKTKLKQGINIF